MNFFKKNQELIIAQSVLLIISVIFGSFFLVNSNSVILANNNSPSGGTGGQAIDTTHTEGLVKCQNPPNCTFEELMLTADAVAEFMTQLGVAFIAIIFSYAGWLYITANGNEGQVKQAHEMFGKAAMGLMIVLLAFLIIELLVSGLGLDTEIIELKK